MSPVPIGQLTEAIPDGITDNQPVTEGSPPPAPTVRTSANVGGVPTSRRCPPVDTSADGCSGPRNKAQGAFGVPLTKVLRTPLFGAEATSGHGAPSRN
jgi:hypothetical protein